jgi:hypothetical protein
MSLFIINLTDFFEKKPAYFTIYKLFLIFTN